MSLASNVLATVAGVLSHQLYFKHGEHHLNGAKYVEIFLSIFIASNITISWWFRTSFQVSLQVAGRLSIFYFTGLYTSLLAYRVCFHPLNRFRGPFSARASNLWFSTQCLNADAHKQLLKLHQQYDTDFLRVGSSDLSITHPQGVTAIYGPNSLCIKSDWYDIDFPKKPMMAERDKAKHDKRRRSWAFAFSDKALRGYQQRIRKYEEQLRDQFLASEGRPVNVRGWFNFYGFDTMGDLAFGESFDNLTTGQYHFAAALVKKGLDMFSLTLPTWIVRMMMLIPGSTKDYKAMNQYCWEKIESHYRKQDHPIPDIASNVFAPFKSRGTQPSKQEWLQLHADSRTILVAGSDTTAATMTFLFYFLTREPSVQKRLREEVLPFVDANGDSKPTDLQDLPYLNGCINETHRLQPLLPSSLRRVTPPGGLQVGDVHIPGNMIVFCPQYVTGRKEEIYAQSEAFIPERWFSKPEMVKIQGAFAPFSLGTYSCIGKSLALMNVRSLTAKLLATFDVAFAPGEDGFDAVNKSRDHFTLEPGDLRLVFTPRKHS